MLLNKELDYTCLLSAKLIHETEVTIKGCSKTSCGCILIRTRLRGYCNAFILYFKTTIEAAVFKRLAAVSLFTRRWQDNNSLYNKQARVKRKYIYY